MEQGNGKGLVVLIAEDFADAREMYEDYLIFTGITVRVCCNWPTELSRKYPVTSDFVPGHTPLP